MPHKAKDPRRHKFAKARYRIDKLLIGKEQMGYGDLARNIKELS